MYPRSLTGILQIKDVIKIIVYQNQMDYLFQLKRLPVYFRWTFLENAGGEKNVKERIASFAFSSENI